MKTEIECPECKSTLIVKTTSAVKPVLITATIGAIMLCGVAAIGYFFYDRKPEGPTHEELVAPWRELREGMTMQEVEQLLGPPDRTSYDTTFGTEWWYGTSDDNAKWKPRVQFSPNEKVAGWYSP